MEIYDDFYKHNELYGGSWLTGLIDKARGIINNTYEGAKSLVKQTFSPRLDSFNNMSRKFLEKHGNKEIDQINIFRTPLDDNLDAVLQALSLGKWNELKKKYGYDKLFHVGLWIRLKGGTYVLLHKTENVDIELGSMSKWYNKKTTEIHNVPLQGKHITLNEFVEKARKRVGNKKFFEYDPFKNNCQYFLRYLLQASGLYTAKAKHFLFQDIEELQKELPDYVKNTAKGITDLAGFWSKLIGKGKKGDEIVAKKQLNAYQSGALRVMKAMSFNHKNIELVGSMSIKSQLYASDYDMFEVVKGKSIADVERRFKLIIKHLEKMSNIYIGDIKCGEVQKWKIPHTLSKSLKIQKLNTLKGILSTDEMKYAKSISNKKNNVIFKKNIDIHKIRWSPREIIEGRKELRDGRDITFQQALQTPALFKLDVIALTNNGIFTEFSIIYDVYVGKKNINPVELNIVKAIKEDIQYYNKVGNSFKVLKRMFSLARYEYISGINKNKNEKTLIKLTKILNSDMGILNAVRNDIDALIYLLYNEDRLPMRKIQNEIQGFRSRLSNVYSVDKYLKNNKHILAKLKNLEALQDKKELIAELQYIKSLLI